MSKNPLTKLLVPLAHRAVHSAEHNPQDGKLHGYCIVCGVPWPCETADKFMLVDDTGKVLLTKEQWDRVRLEGLNYALNIAQGRRVLNRPPAYLACVDEMEIFLKAAIERVEAGEDMNSVAYCQSADTKGTQP